MALRIEVYIEGEEDKGPINLLASLTSLRQRLLQLDDAKHTTVTLKLSSRFSARQTNSGNDWESQGELSRVWREGEWVVYDQPDEYELLARAEYDDEREREAPSAVAADIALNKEGPA